MATFRQRHAALLLEAERLLTDDFTALAGRIRARILARSNAEGVVLPADWSRLDTDLSALILGYLLGGITATPFRVQGDGTFEPLSDYAVRYQAVMYLMTLLALEQQAGMLRRQYPADIERRLRAARINPLARPDALPEAARGLFRDFTAQHDVVRADNRALMDRMVVAAGETRRKTALLLRELLASGRSAREIAETMERFLTVGLNTPNAPYGTKGIYDSLRLLLSEAVFAHARAGVMAAALNPQVRSVEVFTSPRHREIDNCDEVVMGNPYAVENCPIPPFHAHCACGLRFVVGKTTQAAITRFREGGMMDVKGALSPDFAQILLRGR